MLGSCFELQVLETRPVCVSTAEQYYLPYGFYIGENPPAPWDGPGATLPSLAAHLIGSARAHHVFGKGLSLFRAHGLAGLCCIVLISWSL